VAGIDFVVSIDADQHQVVHIRLAQEILEVAKSATSLSCWLPPLLTLAILVEPTHRAFVPWS
jgi:hypothetical protein